MWLALVADSLWLHHHATMYLTLLVIRESGLPDSRMNMAVTRYSVSRVLYLNLCQCQWHNAIAQVIIVIGVIMMGPMVTQPKT